MASLQHVVVDQLFKAANAAHRALVGLSGGRLGGRIAGMPVVELATTGRRTGERRTVMLTAPVVEGDRLVLVASKGGDARPPAWFLNLVADPDVEVRMDGTTRAMRARVATPEERAALWPRIVEVYGGYAGYQRRTEREIPVVIVEPRE